MAKIRFTPTAAVPTFRFNHLVDGSVETVTCNRECVVETNDACAKALLRDYDSLFEEVAAAEAITSQPSRLPEPRADDDASAETDAGLEVEARTTETETSEAEPEIGALPLDEDSLKELKEGENAVE